jgi:hypothetical protein
VKDLPVDVELLGDFLQLLFLVNGHSFTRLLESVHRPWCQKPGAGANKKQEVSATFPD